MADKVKSPKTTTLEKVNSDKVSEVEPNDTEKLSAKLTNIAVVNSSLKTVSDTCHSIKESNSYVGYGMTMAESSLDKAFKAGMAVLDSTTFAPITNTALEKVRYFDKEAGVMVDRFLRSKETERNEKQANGAVQDIPEDEESASLAARNESMFYFLGRKFFEVTYFLIFLPYTGPKYALTSIWGLFQGRSKEAGRKRKERGSMCEEVKRLEPSPVKRKYGDRQSTSSEEETLVEILKDYVSEDDPDYQPKEHESEETSEGSEHESDRKEDLKESLYLAQQLEKMGVPISPHTQKVMRKIRREAEEMGIPISPELKLKSDAKEMGIPVSPELKLKSDTKESDTSKSQSTTEKEPDNPPLFSNNDQNHVPEVKEDEINTQAKTKVKSEPTMEEIPLKDYTSESKDKNEASKDAKESKTSKIDPSSKTRRSSKSPLLERLLSPGRRSRKSQKDKTKSAEKAASEGTVIAEAGAEESASKSEDNTKMKKDATKTTEKSVDDSAKNASKTEEAATSKTKSAETAEKGKEKAESSKVEVKSGESHHESDPLSVVSGPFDTFRFGGKKSK